MPKNFNLGSQGCKATFEAMEFYTPWALEQKWGFSKQQGYLQKLGMGKCTDPSIVQFPSVLDVQLYLRQWLAHVHGCTPNQLCWQKDGFGLKPQFAPGEDQHRDPHDQGRNQCVVGLGPAKFVVWPRSHLLENKNEPGSWLFSKAWLEQNGCHQFVYQGGPGDVLVFKGGFTVHGSPPVAVGEPNRVVTYATFWPPASIKGANHEAGRCDCKPAVY